MERMIFACVGTKGGTGKSTIAVNLAAAMVARGDRVLLVDADERATARLWHEVSVARERRLLPVIESLAGIGTELPRSLQRDGWEIVVDCCSDKADAMGALAFADVALIPSSGSAPDAWGLAQSITAVERAQARRSSLRACLVPNRIRDMRGMERMRSEFAASSLPLAPCVIADRVEYQRALGEGGGVCELFPTGEAALEIDELLIWSSALRRMPEEWAHVA